LLRSLPRYDKKNTGGLLAPFFFLNRP